jgi:hypothetical protein
LTSFGDAGHYGCLGSGGMTMAIWVIPWLLITIVLLAGIVAVTL